MKLLKTIVSAIDDGKAEDIKVLDMNNVSPLVDYMVLATGRSDRQVQALVTRVKKAVTENGFDIKHIEGNQMNLWVLVDCKDIIVHVFQEDERVKYNLESLWADVPRLQVDDILE
ncbi:ribosome silencing factor [Haloplasma contractile]|uniref:Ribosomal silencing factor RsfS n=1 Tax=Haloplasma contractile SSD-17B TaxID=1033810 RepID=U2FRY4_9MOLU|nr:ribosome silencing factor [Haloplasma contractile]ERJ13729.1 Iojap-like ribosome-associated protein [Haloplasma contractile SSD-17B]